MNMILIVIILGFLSFLLLVGLYYRIRMGTVAGSSGGVDRRKYPRLPLQVSAEVVMTADGRKLAGRTRDLSIMGMFFKNESNESEVPAGDECKVCLLVERDGASIRLNLKGKVVRRKEEGLGVEFTAMNRECYENLRYLTHYNAACEIEAKITDAL
jgi:hypothetical protein